MGYWELSLLADDADFTQRNTACATTEGIESPQAWAVEHRWDMAASPSFADAYASAIAGGVPNPGRDPSVISDAQILSAVQTLTASRKE